jgi:hypothetical protein
MRATVGTFIGIVFGFFLGFFGTPRGVSVLNKSDKRAVAYSASQTTHYPTRQQRVNSCKAVLILFLAPKVLSRSERTSRPRNPRFACSRNATRI